MHFGHACSTVPDNGPKQVVASLNQIIMKTKLFSFLVPVAVLCGALPLKGQYVPGTEYSEELRPYVEFIENCNEDPVDYVFRLFDKYDIVVMGERDHRDTTQYDLFERIFADPRFAENVGHVMTELGSSNMSEQGSRLINPETFDDTVFYPNFICFVRNSSDITIPEKTNFYHLHRDLYNINKNLPPDKRIDIHYTGRAFHWPSTGEMTREDYKNYRKYSGGGKYDIILAENAVNAYCKILDGPDPRKKVFIIYNRPHSYREYDIWEDGKPSSTGGAAQLIAYRFPGKMANVMLNWSDISHIPEEYAIKYDIPENYVYIPYQKGKWDAAFAVCGDKSIGFDFAGTPFGEDDFDTYDPPRNKTTYADIYNGFIFYLPQTDWVASGGYKDLMDPEFEEEYRRRIAIFSDRPEWLYDVWSQGVESGPVLEDYETEIYYDHINKFFQKPGTEKGK